MLNKNKDKYNFIELCIQNKLPAPIPEYRFHEMRRWRIDYAFLDVKLAVEIEGGVWIAGRHNRAVGYIKDMEKYNSLVELGWAKLSYQPKKIYIDQIKRVYKNRKKIFKKRRTNKQLNSNN